MFTLKKENKWRLAVLDFEVIWQINLLVMCDIHIEPTN